MDGRLMAENIKEYVCCSMQINGLPVEARYSRECVDQILMKEMNLPQNRAVAILYNYDHPSSNPD